MAPSKKKPAPKPPPKEILVIPPRTPSEQVFDALVGRGIRPLSLWASSLFVPGLLLLGFGPETGYETTILVLMLLIWGWTVPWERIASILIDVRNIRESLADCAPLIPGMLPYVPEMARVIVPNAVKLAPAFGTLAPYLKYLLKYPEFAAKSLPLLVPKFDIMMKYNMIEQLGPSFPHLDMRHYSKLEKILPDMMAKLELLAPYFHIIAPHVVEISLRADRLFPHIEYMLPHAETMKDHIWWLIPFADIDGFELFMPHLDELAPMIDDLAPYGPDLLPYFAKMRKHIPILIENAPTLLPQLCDVVDQMDPLVYWLGDLLPLANSIGVLKSQLLLRAGLPFLGLLPKVPPRKRTRIPKKKNASAYRREEAKRVISVPRTHIGVDQVVYYVVEVDGRYSGEFRYSALRILHEFAQKTPDLDEPLPEFPAKSTFSLSNSQIEDRRVLLEDYLQCVLAEPKIVKTKEFTEFVQEHRKWDAQLPLLTSPLMKF